MHIVLDMRGMGAFGFWLGLECRGIGSHVDLFLDQPFDIPQPGAFFVLIAEADCNALRPRPTGSADAVNIGFGFIRNVIIHNV